MTELTGLAKYIRKSNWKNVTPLAQLAEVIEEMDSQEKEEWQQTWNKMHYNIGAINSTVSKHCTVGQSHTAHVWPSKEEPTYICPGVSGE